MDKQLKKYLIGIFLSLGLCFVWIFLTVFLTGGKELSDFSTRDWDWFAGFVVAEAATLVVMFVCVFKLVRRSQAANPSTAPKPESGGKRAYLLLLAAYLTALALLCLGIVWGNGLPEAVTPWLQGCLAGCCILPQVSLCLNLLLRRWFLGQLQQARFDQVQRYILSHREYAEETSRRKLALIQWLRRLTDLYAGLLCVFAAGIALCSGAVCSADSSTLFCLLSGFLFLCGFSRIRFPLPKQLLDTDKTVLSAQEYPRLYGLARRAALTQGYTGEIRIAVSADSNVGIGKAGNTYVIELGAYLLHLCAQEEIFAILLHEFAHTQYEAGTPGRDANYTMWLSNGGNPHFLSSLTTWFFCYFDTVYGFQYSLYRYASSILQETAADQAMLRYGDQQAAASALLKLKYLDLYEWEQGTRDETCFFAGETMNPTWLTDKIAAFQEALETRQAAWRQLTAVEIQSRSASHPPVRARLEAMGVREPHLLAADGPVDYRAECRKAVVYIQDLVVWQSREGYAQQRKAHYLEPKALVEAWEAAGKPLIPEDYGEVVTALRELGRVSEANALCDRAIAELPSAAGCFACYMKGMWLLHTYDAAGIDYIYQAIEHNTNYIREGLGAIGGFCCLTGRQKDLDTYRERAVTLGQREKDLYSELGILRKKDRLSAETLPEGMLERILTYIRSIDGGAIARIYLVRKTITEDFFTSVFVVQFTAQADAETQRTVLHKLFNYLDTCSDWQFSLFNYTDVAKAKVENIENSLVYTKD